MKQGKDYIPAHGAPRSVTKITAAEGSPRAKPGKTTHERPPAHREAR